MAQNDHKNDSVFAIPLGYDKKKPALPWFEARVRVNKHLLHKVGSAFIADEPKLVDAERLLLAVPILYTLSERDNQEVGRFYVKADTNEIVFERSDSREQIYENAGIDRKDTLSSLT
jgi:hypothetical protein